MDDIVYFVKESPINEELRYSLRSLVNFPHGKVILYGGCPDGIIPDMHIKVNQDKENKWQNVSKMLRMACSNNAISKNFWLFNDDFFIMKKVKKPCNYYNGDLYKRIVMIEDSHGRITPYSQQLRNMCKELEAMGCETKNYTLHVPILINRAKAVELLNMTENPMFRSMYANYAKIGGEQMRDVKIVSRIKLYKDGIYLSTDDNSFDGAVGKQIREMFQVKSQYEK